MSAIDSVHGVRRRSELSAKLMDIHLADFVNDDDEIPEVRPSADWPELKEPMSFHGVIKRIKSFLFLNS